MANESSKVEVSTEINVKDNASTNIDKVTSERLAGIKDVEADALVDIVLNLMPLAVDIHGNTEY